MNDDELKARLAQLRIPPIDTQAREQALVSALRALRTADDSPPATPHWTWREWLWPSPLAWGALVVVWFAILLYRPVESPKQSSFTDAANPPSSLPLRAPLFARSDVQLWLTELELQRRR